MNIQSLFTRNYVYVFLILLLCISIFFIRGYTTRNLYLPKPKGHPRFEIPDHSYVQFDKNYPYSFEYSKHAQIIEHREEDKKYWINVYYPDLNATIYITYKPVYGNQKLLKEYWKEFYKNLSIHYRLASGVDEKTIENKNGSSFNLIKIKGEHIASQYQFLTSDHNKHFLIGVLYFNQFPDQEYLEPLIKYMKKDIDQLIKSFQWNKNFRLTK